MFSNVALLATAALVLSVAAGGDSQCNTGPIQCCQSIHQSQSSVGSGLAALVGAAVQNVNTDVGFNCSPITAAVGGVAGGSGAQCSSQPVCCNGNHFDGLVTVGCSPINL